jgi:predicted enzyme related to lactoylglutathione lyase
MPIASAKFYSALFGWTREDMNVGDFSYGMFKAGERPVGGTIVLPPEAESMPPIWMVT